MSDLIGFDEPLDPERGMDLPKEFKWEGTLSRLIEAVRLALRQMKVSETDIEKIAPVVVIRICETLGGQPEYIPQGAAVRRALRNRKIHDEWDNGASHESLAQRHHMTLQAVYGIIQKERQLARRRGPDLFGFDD